MDYETIEQYALGINFQVAVPFIDAPAPLPLGSFIMDAYVNYRPFLWLNFKLGVTNLVLSFEGTGMKVSEVFPDLAGEPIGNEGIDFFNDRAEISETTFMIGVDYNWVVTEWLNLAFGITLNHFERPMMTQIYGRGFVDLNNNGNYDALEDYETMFKCIHHFSSVDMIRFEFKPQIIVIPRLTLGLVAGYTLASKLKVEYAEIGDEVYSSVGESEDSVKKYFNISRKNFVNGKNVEDIKLNGMWYLGLNVNFFF